MRFPALVEEWKLRAAERALGYLEDGMLVGLGTGSTAAKFVDLLGRRVKEGFEVTCVATSEGTRLQAERLGIALTTLDDVPFLDLTVDGADELDADLRLIKGGGGALLREKIVAAASKRMIVIADRSKLVPMLGRFPLPIEVNRFGLKATELAIGRAAASLGLAGPLALRTRDGTPFVTDGGHLIIDASFGRIPDPRALSGALHAIPGVVEHGLFLGMASAAILAAPDGIEVLGRA
jgi:ribose 5-phosphate isomerase A